MKDGLAAGEETSTVFGEADQAEMDDLLMAAYFRWGRVGSWSLQEAQGSVG